MAEESSAERAAREYHAASQVNHPGDYKVIDHVCFDIEIQKTIEETPGGWDATDLLGVSVAAIWEYRTARMRIYGPDDVEALRARLLKADRISGFNIFNFDMPTVWGVSKKIWSGNCISLTSDAGTEVMAVKQMLARKTDDMLRRIWQALGLNPDVFSEQHKGWGLDAVAADTLGARKIGYGGDAPKWFQAGQWARLANYCCDDAALERDLTDFVERYGFVLKGGRRLAIPPWKGA